MKWMVRWVVNLMNEIVRHESVENAKSFVYSCVGVGC